MHFNTFHGTCVVDVGALEQTLLGQYGFDFCGQAVTLNATASNIAPSLSFIVYAVLSFYLKVVVPQSNL